MLDLGKIDVSAPGMYSFRLENLPETQFVAGIELVQLEPLGMTDEREASRGGVVRMTLIATNGDTVVREEAPLQRWVWSHGLDDTQAFLYRRGESKDVPIGSGAVNVVRVHAKAREGWGSYFTPAAGEEYFLKLDVLEGREYSVLSTKLVLKGE